MPEQQENSPRTPHDTTGPAAARSHYMVDNITWLNDCMTCFITPRPAYFWSLHMGVAWLPQDIAINRTPSINDYVLYHHYSWCYYDFSQDMILMEIGPSCRRPTKFCFEYENITDMQTQTDRQTDRQTDGERGIEGNRWGGLATRFQLVTYTW